jgi:hypothetical protein
MGIILPETNKETTPLLILIETVPSSIRIKYYKLQLQLSGYSTLLKSFPSD